MISKIDHENVQLPGFVWYAVVDKRTGYLLLLTIPSSILS